MAVWARTGLMGSLTLTARAQAMVSTHTTRSTGISIRGGDGRRVQRVVRTEYAASRMDGSQPPTPNRDHAPLYASSSRVQTPDQIQAACATNTTYTTVAPLGTVWACCSLAKILLYNCARSLLYFAKIKTKIGG